jgi:hypothetical protein
MAPFLIESAKRVPIMTPMINLNIVFSLILVVSLVNDVLLTLTELLGFAWVPMRDRAQIADYTRIESRFLAAFRAGVDKRFTAFRTSA